MEDKKIYPDMTKELADKKAALAPQNVEAWRNFSKTVFKAGALDEKTKQLIAVAVAHVTQCPYCIKSHTPQAIRKGASKEEVLKAANQLQKKIHPDMNRNVDSSRLSQLVNEAKEKILKTDFS